MKPHHVGHVNVTIRCPGRGGPLPHTNCLIRIQQALELGLPQWGSPPVPRLEAGTSRRRLPPPAASEAPACWHDCLLRLTTRALVPAPAASTQLPWACLASHSPARSSRAPRLSSPSPRARRSWPTALASSLGGSRSSAPACSSTSGETRSGPWPSAGESTHGQREEKGLLGAAPLPAEALAAIPDSQSCLGVPARPPAHLPLPLLCCCAAMAPSG